MTESPTSAPSEVCYRHPGVEAGVSCQRCARTICGQCMNQASVGWHCPSCVKNSSQRVIPARQLMQGAGGDFTVTKILVGINVVIHFLASIGDANPDSSEALADIDSDGILVGALVNDGEWWRLLTSGFLHSGMGHILMNMFGLWIFGRMLEPQLGRAGYLLLYVGSLLTGSAAVVAIEQPFTATLGASGAIYGLVGAYAVWAWSRGRNLWEDGIVGMIGLYIFFTFAFPNISIGGHMGGLAGGIVLGLLLFVGARKLSPGHPALLGGAAAWCVAMFVAGIVLSGV